MSINGRSIAILAAVIFVAGCAFAPPKHFMTDDHQFTPCPSAPHCVSSQTPENSSKHIAPLAYQTSEAAARNALLVALGADNHATVIKADLRFVHATFKTTLGFVDDVTFLIQADRNLIDVKSQSRVGYYDFGKNRRRVEQLRKAFEARLAQS